MSPVPEQSRVRLPRDELSRATLAVDLETEEGKLPKGSSGTIVHVYLGGPAYEIEFVEPFHVVATVPAEALE